MLNVRTAIEMKSSDMLLSARDIPFLESDEYGEAMHERPVYTHHDSRMEAAVDVFWRQWSYAKDLGADAAPVKTVLKAAMASFAIERAVIAPSSASSLFVGRDITLQ
jgi:hypothetical protein